MTKAQFERLLRAAGKATRETDFIVFGSQAILGYLASPPRALLVSVEADFYPKNYPQAVPLIESKLGRRSRFSKTHGYFADNVTPELATFPDGWMERLIPFRTQNTGGVTGWCVEVHDLAISKMAAGRPKDLRYLRCLLRHRLVKPTVLKQRLAETPLKDADRKLLELRLYNLLHPARPKAARSRRAG